MRINLLYALASVAIVSLLSLVGLATVSFSEKTLRQVIFIMVGLATGGLFGDAFLHILPESLADPKQRLNVSLYILAGIFAFFVLEKFLLWRHEHTPESTIRPVGYMNLLADAIHNSMDGMIIGASYLVSLPIGIATTLAVICHEIPHELGNFFVLLYAGFSRRRALLFNFLSAIFAVLGTVLSLLIGSRIQGFATFMLPFAAGGFIYIAGSDLLPELHKETHPLKSAAQLIAMVTGVGLMLLLKLLG